MGEIKKYKISAKTLDDKEVKDSLEALSHLNGKIPYFLVGGVATQSYLPSLCRRPTSDVDTSVVRPLNYSDFLEISKPVAEFMSDNGYIVKPRKGSRAFSLACESKEGYETIIEFVRRNKKNFEKHKKRLERELENTNAKIIESRNAIYFAKRPEDISVPKLIRMVNSLRRNPYLSKYVPNQVVPLSEKEIKRKIETINSIREEIMHNPADLGLAERLRFISDMYDIRILSEIIGFNKNYFKRAESDWNGLDKDKNRNRILKATFPSILDN